MVDVKEMTKVEIAEKLRNMHTSLTKISYLESALKKTAFTFEIKRFIWDNLILLYEERKMYEKAAKASAGLAGIEVAFREKIECYLKAGEFYSKVGKIEDSEEMFTRAVRNSTSEQKVQILLARKNVYLASAQELISKGKRASALKFYEKLSKMKLDDLERKEVKENLITIYKALGRFKEAEFLGGL